MRFKGGEPGFCVGGEGEGVCEEGVDCGGVRGIELVGAFEEAGDADADVDEGDVGVDFGGFGGHGHPFGGVEHGAFADVVADAELGW